MTNTPDSPRPHRDRQAGPRAALPTWRLEAASVYPMLRRHANAVAGLSAAVTFVVVAALGVLRTSLPDPTVVLLLVLCVVAASATGLRRAGLVSTATAAAGFGYVLAPPYYSFSFESSEDVQVALLLFLVGAAVTELAHWGRAQQAAASAEAAHLDGILETAQLATAPGATPAWLPELVALQIRAALGVDSVTFEPLPRGRLMAAAVVERDGSVTWAGQRLDTELDGLPTDCEIVFAPRGPAPADYLKPRLVMSSATYVARPDRRQRRVALALADQLS